MTRSNLIVQLVQAILVISFFMFFALMSLPASAHPPADDPPRDPITLSKSACARDPKNLVTNGTMGPDHHDTPFGTVADGWDPFVFGGSPPNFRWVDNEQIDPGGSQQIYTSDTFDAGVMQTVHNLQPGTQYWFRLGYSLAAKSYNGPNVRVDSIGRKVGVDPFGGTDSHSPNIIWGPDFFDGGPAVNIYPAMYMVFPARSPNATIFLRAIARDNSGGENRVWLDAVCMEARPDLPTVPIQPTPVPLPPTATPLPPRPTARFMPTPTRTRTPTKTPPVTTVALAPTVTPTALIETDTATPTRAAIRARPVVTPSPESSIDLDSSLLTEVGAGSIAGALIFFVLGLVSWRRSI